ncbi:MAG: HDOD domain-containing protein [Nitrospirae bacterium]|nr:HDOD domain-containing protein [Nitrospirota bacterium]
MPEILIKSRLQGLTSLPTLPPILSKLIKALQKERASIFEVAEILRCDQSLAARIVAVANSPFFGYPGKINSIDQALLMLGFDMVKSISLGVSVFGFLPAQYPSVRQMWAHSYGVAALSGAMCSRIPVADKSICFLGGLLHDIGRAVFLKLHRDEYVPLLKADALVEAETRKFQCDHAQVGGWFLESLSFPLEIALSVHHHHTVAGDMEHKGIATSVYLAEGLIGLLNPDLACDGQWTEEHAEEFEERGLGESDMKEFKALLIAEAENLAGLFDL